MIIDLDKRRVPSSPVEPVRGGVTRKKSRGAYLTQYEKDNYDVIRLRFRKGSKAWLAAEAEKRGVSISQFIRDSVDYYIDHTKSQFPWSDVE